MTEDKKTERKKRARAIVRVLRREFPNANVELNFSNTWELLVAVILSAQCTDKMVNHVTDTLFKKYPALTDYVSANFEEFALNIKKTGFYRNKAKHILGSAKKIYDECNGTVPDEMDALLTLPGVARKTANVVLQAGFDKAEGIAVDTHIRRLAYRFDLSDSRVPEKIEQDLLEILPKKEWSFFGTALVLYGRHICPARKHECDQHPLTHIYPDAINRWPRAQ